MFSLFFYGPGEGLRPRRLSISEGRRVRTHWVRIPPKFSNKKDLQVWKSFLKFGPGGIRTHDQRIMSPLRYRCATGPWRLLLSFHFALGAALAGSFAPALPTSPRTRHLVSIFRYVE